MQGAREEAAAPPPRKRIVDLLARATLSELQAGLAALGSEPTFSLVRGPETGLVMVRGRIGGGGSAFNLGEATMSRASIRLEDGRIGHAYRLGTDRKAATLAAVLEAESQRADTLAVIEEALLAPLSARLAKEAETLQAETGATKVDFFTMVRGED